MHTFLAILPDSIDIGNMLMALLVVMTSGFGLWILKMVAAKTKNKYDDQLVAKFVEFVGDQDINERAKERLNAKKR